MTITDTPTHHLSAYDLAGLQAEVRKVNDDNGWFEKDRDFEEGIALIHSAVIARGLARVVAFLALSTDELGIDLMAEYDRKVKFNATRGHRHGGKRL